jgi:hypothetical protein
LYAERIHRHAGSLVTFDRFYQVVGERRVKLRTQA